MLKRLSASLLAAPLLLGLIPTTAADAAPARPEGGARSSAQDNRTIRPFDHRDDDHYRCMYNCDRRDRYTGPTTAATAGTTTATAGVGAGTNPCSAMTATDRKHTRN